MNWRLRASCGTLVRALRKRGKALALLLGGGLLLWIMLRWFEHHQVYQPDRTMSTAGTNCEDLFFSANDGVQCHGWFFPALTNSPRRSMVVLVCHGNGGNISHRLELSEALLQTGMNVLLFDYRGYGRSGGRPSEEGTYQDAMAAHRWLKQKGFLPKNIIAYGESLGGGVASELAMRTELAGLVLQSTFTSIPDIGAELFPWLPVRSLGRIKYDTRLKLSRIRVPVLVVHSRVDEIVPFRHAEKNFAAANDPKLFWEIKGDHNNPLFDPSLFTQGLERFLGVIESTRTRVSTEAK